jgi:hypothetical protein
MFETLVTFCLSVSCAMVTVYGLADLSLPSGFAVALCFYLSYFMVASSVTFPVLNAKQPSLYVECKNIVVYNRTSILMTSNIRLLSDASR